MFYFGTTLMIKALREQKITRLEQDQLIQYQEVYI